MKVFFPNFLLFFSFDFNRSYSFCIASGANLSFANVYNFERSMGGGNLRRAFQEMGNWKITVVFVILMFFRNVFKNLEYEKYCSCRISESSPLIIISLIDYGENSKDANSDLLLKL